MSRNLLRFGLALFLSISGKEINLQAQSTVQKSSVFETEYAGFSPKLLHEKAGKIYGANVAHNLIRVVVYNKANLSEESQFDVEIGLADLTQYALLDLIWFNGRITAIIKEDNASATWLGVKALPINIETRKLEKPIMLYRKKYDKRSERGQFKVDFSKERLVLQNASYSIDRGITEKLWTIYDADLKKLMSYEYQVQGKEEDLYSSVVFDQEGNLYFQNDDQLFIHPMDETKPVKKIALPMIKEEELIAFSFQVAAMPNGQIAICAFYQSEDSIQEANSNFGGIEVPFDDFTTEGILYYVFDPSSQGFVVQRKHKFEQDYVDRFLEDDAIGKQSRIPQVFTNIKLYFDEIGACYLLGERLVQRPMFDFGVIYSTNTTDVSKQTGETFELEDLILLKLDVRGDIAWQEYVPKMQRYIWRDLKGIETILDSDRALTQRPLGEYDYFSFYARLGEEGIELFYNDDEKNKQGRVSYEDVKLYRYPDQGGPVYLLFDKESGAAKTRAFWEDLVAEDDLFFKTQNLFYSELEKSYYGILSRKEDFQLIRFRP
ncbi:MAG: hypothetical protein NXI09_11895 [Bacteroidetes bacterium]|nr:hypothetical protein [Bacteroidota bacterium]